MFGRGEHGADSIGIRIDAREASNQFAGSYSLKHVLPTLVPDMSYEDGGRYPERAQ
jgi:hypothetical protein